MDVLLSQPRGFCAGVIRAIEIVERALELHGAPVYVLHEIVHNRHVVDELRREGAIFVESLEEVPAGAVTIFSAHGVARQLVRTAEERRLVVIDATCPLVTKVHLQAQRYHRGGMELVIIGHEGHPEVEGHRGQVDGPVHVLATVEEVAALRVRDPERVATQNRQNALRAMAAEVDVLLVVGARNSSNSNRLREVGEQSRLRSYLIESAAGLESDLLAPDARIGITAGASAPETLVQEVVQRLRELGVRRVVEMEGEPERTVFPLPAAVARRDAVPTRS